MLKLLKKFYCLFVGHIPVESQASNNKFGHVAAGTCTRCDTILRYSMTDWLESAEKNEGDSVFSRKNRGWTEE